MVNPDSFSHLPEYSEDPEIKLERLSPLRRGSIAASLASSFGRDSAVESVPVSGDPNIVVLPRFEDVARRGTGKDCKPPQSPTLTRIKTEDFDEAMADTETEISLDEKCLEQFRKVVWKQLVPAEIDHLDGMARSSAIVIESEAAFFPPVGYVPRSLRLSDIASSIMP